MKHHKKSNNGVFSKKQKRASRHMMAMRRGRDLKQQNLEVTQLPEPGLMAKVLGMVLGARRARG